MRIKLKIIVELERLRQEDDVIVYCEINKKRELARVEVKSERW